MNGRKEPEMNEQGTPVSTEKNAFLRFLARKDIVFSAKRYGIDALGAMALGLFGSLLIATVFNALGLIPGLAFFKSIGSYGAKAAGPAMAVAIAFALKAPPFVMYSSALVGLMANDLGAAGGPLAVLLITIVAVECGKAVSKETKVDILVTPFVTVLVGGGLALLVAPHIGTLVSFVGKFIGWATEQQPFVMGLVISVVVGVALTLPISSAAICAAIGLSGAALAGGAVPPNAEGLALAGGAAVAGCCAQMVGFAVMSFKENRWSGLVSQGIGTSMIQMPNIVRNPRIWIPPTVASAITGPLATCVFGMKMYGAAINSGMGTCGLLGPIGIILGWFGGEYPETVSVFDWIGLLLICFLLPAVISWGLGLLLRRIGWIREDDLKLDQ
ncbi:MAG: PTS sugar transporter subunit IIC [Ruminococcaceae bacterium]|nr:PTS sugar transporter subunit IIC [Oscillospiraceae bacterium]